MSPFIHVLIYFVGIALSGLICWSGGREHRDRQWKKALRLYPEQTAMFAHGIRNALPEVAEED